MLVLGHFGGPGFTSKSIGTTEGNWRKYVHEVLVNRLGGLSLPMKSVVRLTDRPDMTLDVYRGRKTTMQQQQRLRENPCYYLNSRASILRLTCSNSTH